MTNKPETEPKRVFPKVATVNRRAMTTMRAIALLLLLAAASASAQPATFYGPDGRVVGSAVTIGRTTSFYGPGGRFEGSAVRIGNGASF